MAAVLKEVQGAIRSALAASSDLAALVGARIHDETPATVLFPFVQIAGLVARPMDAGGVVMTDAAATIIVWSRPPSGGKTEAATIAAAVVAATTTTSINLTGHGLVDIREASTTIDRGDDGITVAAVIVLTLQVDTEI